MADIDDLERVLDEGGLVSGRQAAEVVGTYPAYANEFAEEYGVPRLGGSGAFVFDAEAVDALRDAVEEEGGVTAFGGEDDADLEDEDDEA